MTRDERWEKSKRICQKITTAVSEMSPEGLGHWPPTWEMVEDASNRFLDELDRWVEHGTPELQENVKTAAEALLAAWHDAIQLYRAQGQEEAGHARV